MGTRLLYGLIFNLLLLFLTVIFLFDVLIALSRAVQIIKKANRIKPWDEFVLSFFITNRISSSVCDLNCLKNHYNQHACL